MCIGRKMHVLVVHVEIPSCFVIGGADVLCKTSKHFHCERSELQICRVHRFRLGCIKNWALYVWSHI